MYYSDFGIQADLLLTCKESGEGYHLAVSDNYRSPQNMGKELFLEFHSRGRDVGDIVVSREDAEKLYEYLGKFLEVGNVSQTA